ncbi:EVE domain-containing protein [Streptomyces sp. ISL-90]|nr:EVE domain-containing protein [Streptomyces sp. ISL-90]
MTAWLGVASAEHVRRGLTLGIAQIGHGKRAGLARMKPGDLLAYYSPTERLRDGVPLKQFTAIGRVADDVIWQADEGEFRPFRRRVNWEDVAPVDIDTVRDRLALTAQPNWGYQLRRGLIPLTDDDAAVLLDAMRSALHR